MQELQNYCFTSFNQLFLIEFDRWLVTKLSGLKLGFYQRYGDDILIICPTEEVEKLYKEIKSKIGSLGISLSANKTELSEKSGGKIQNSLYKIESSASNRSNIQYLGLEWDGNQIVLRPSTVGRRLRPKDKLSKKYWKYHKQAIQKIGQKAIKKQFVSIRRTINKKGKFKETFPNRHN